MPNILYYSIEIQRQNNVVALATSIPLHCSTKDDKKSKPQIFRFYDFIKGGTDIVDQLDDYYNTRTKTLRWAMITLYYILDIARVNSKIVRCMKKKIDFHKLSSYDFGWSLPNSLTIPHARQRNINDLGMMLQLKRIYFLVQVWMSQSHNLKLKTDMRAQESKKSIKYIMQIAEQKKNMIELHNQLNSVNCVASVFFCVAIVWNKPSRSFELAFH